MIYTAPLQVPFDCSYHFYEQKDMARMITTEVRDERTFRWLMLPTVKIFPVFFSRVSVEENIFFSVIITMESFHHNLLKKLQKSC